MDITRDQANELLQQADAAGKEMRNRRAYGPAGPILMLWGLVWIVCFSASHFIPAHSGLAWLIGDGLGTAGSIFYGAAGRKRRGVRSEATHALGWRMAAFWFALFSYGGVWLAVLAPRNVGNIGFFLVTLVMFAYVVMGLWLERYFFVRLGLLVTALAGAGYWLALAQLVDLNLWLGLTGGAALLASGIYLTWRWR